MKKLILLVTVFVLAFGLTGCFNQEEYLPKDEVEAMLQEVQDDLDVLEQSYDDNDHLWLTVEDLELYYTIEVIDGGFLDLEILIENQKNVKERIYDIVKVEIVSVNDNVYLVETSNLLNPDQYILVSINETFEVGDETHIALYYDGDVRLWNELKEFEGE